MKINICDYVRTLDGLIKKIIDNRDNVIVKTDDYTVLRCMVIKSSPNITDLLKKKDLIVDYDDNIYQVQKVYKDYVFTDKKNEHGQVITLVDYQIKSIVTKEQFSSMEYKINE